jgi:hypothetical protein
MPEGTTTFTNLTQRNALRPLERDGRPIGHRNPGPGIDVERSSIRGGKKR